MESTRETVAHTPGPWRYAEPLPQHERPMVWGPDERQIADCGGWPNRTHAERQANARLIAAAPDLLAVVRDFLDAPDADSLANVAIDARAAIERVAGE